jgi:hypothetical protein
MPFIESQTIRVRNLLASRFLPGWLALVAVILTLPSIRNGFQADDFFHREILLHPADHAIDDSAANGIFTFVDGNSERNFYRMNKGGLPWWTYQQLRISFFRPLAELTHILDYRLWPDSPHWMHLHSLAWYGALVFVVTLLYRHTMTPLWVAGLAAFLYAVDDAHGLPVGWLANRNLVIAAVFGVLSLTFHARWRREGWKAGAILAPVCLAMGLLSSEAAVATGAYIFAYEATLVRRPFRARLAALVPTIVIGIGWWTAYQALGFGAFGSGAYLNPGKDPLLFALALIERIPVLLCGQWLFPDADLYAYLPKPNAYIFPAAATLAVALVAIVLYPLLRRDATARFWGLGMLLAMAPVCATFPTNRLLMFVGIGAMGLMAQFLAAWFGKSSQLPSAKPWRGPACVLAILFVLDHCIGAPLRLPATSTQLARVTRFYLEEPLAELTAHGIQEDKIVFFVNPPTAIMMILIPYIKTELADQLPDQTHVLSSGLHLYIDITRVDRQTLDIEPQGGFASADVDRIFRNSDHPMHPGQQVNLEAVTAEVQSVTGDGRPQRVHFRFPRSLNDPSYLFIEHTMTGMVPFDPPEVGQSVRLTWSTRLGW